MPMSTFASEQSIKYFFTASGVATRPAAWTVALHTAYPGADGATAEVTTGIDSAYARKSVTFAAALNGAIWEAKNSGAVVMNAAGAGASYTITYLSIRDGSGNVLAIIPLTTPVPVVAGTVVTFAINDILIRGDVND